VSEEIRAATPEAVKRLTESCYVNTTLGWSCQLSRITFLLLNI